MTHSGRRTVTVSAVVTAVAALIVSSVTMLPAHAISQVDSIDVGTNPTSIELTPDGTKAFVTNYGDNTVTAIDLATQATTTITVGNSPNDVVMRPGTNELWVTGYASGAISIIDISTLTVIQTFSTIASAYDIAFTADGALAFISIYNADVVLEITASTRAVADTHAVGEGPAGVGIDAERNRLLVANQESNTVSFVNLTTDAVTSLASGIGPTALVVDAPRDQVYVSNYFDNTVRVIDLTSDSEVASITVGGQVSGMNASFDGRVLLVASNAKVSVIDLATHLPSSSWTVAGLTWDVEMSPNGRTVYSAGYSDGSVSVAALEVDRFAGADRYATAIELSQEAYPGTTSAVFIASGTSFPDALSISSAVGVFGGPLLLTAANSLRADVLAEVNRLDPTTIFIAGGTGVVSANVAAQLATTGADVVRLQGADRYATSRAVIREFFDTPSGYSDLYVVNGRDFPDALSAGAAASVGGMPMVLVDGGLNAVPADTITLITTTLKTDRIVLVGGTGVMSADIQSQLDALPGVSVVRAAGADRYATSLAVTRIGFDGRTAQAAFWATGTGFPDALSGITLAAEISSPLLLVRPTCVPASVLSDAWRLGADRIGLVGGTGVLSPAVAALTRC